MTNDIYVVFQLQSLENRLWRFQEQLFRRQPTTGNSTVATQTGSTYIPKVW